ncbi:MAG: hypothetical protein ACOYMN_13265 [Roseimicrobium sp.]|jgi:hypothetical protein
MAFSDYKNIAQVQKEFRIKYQEENFIVVEQVEPSLHFREEYDFNQKNIDVFTSEAARTELVITPILREVYKNFHEQYSFWIQKPIAYNDKLNGTPDYLIATRSTLGKTVLDLPLVVVVEAKKNDFEQGWGQCLAELVAVQKLNDNLNKPVYGIVTDGELWKFGKLVGNTFISNVEGYTVGDLAELFGVLHFIFHAISQDGTSVPVPA